MGCKLQNCSASPELSLMFLHLTLADFTSQARGGQGVCGMWYAVCECQICLVYLVWLRDGVWEKKVSAGDGL